MKWAVEVKIRPRDKFRRLKPRFKLHSSAVAFATHGHPNATYRVVAVEDAPAGEPPRKGRA